MNKFITAAFAALALASVSMPAVSQDQVEIGRLSCDVDGGLGFIIGSSKDMSCAFIRAGQETEYFDGTIKKLGLDIGFTAASRIEWLVFSANPSQVEESSLAGTYVGASSEASLGVGLGANWLVGGSERGVALQPWSAQGSLGLNLTMAVATLELY